MDSMGNNTNHPDNFCLKWSNYQSHVHGVLVQLLEAESMVDVTLCTSSGEKLFAHKIILCAASSYFEEIFSGIDDYHPVVILTEVESIVLRSILQFVYHGELSVDASQLTEVLQVASSLQIRGLTEVNDQLPLLVSTDAELLPPTQLNDSNDAELSPPTQLNDSNDAGHSHELPAFQEVAVVEELEEHCDAEEHGVAFSDAEYENSSNLPKAEEEICGEGSDNRCQIQPSSCQETSGELCNDQSDSWTIDPAVVTDTQRTTKRKRRESCRKEYSEEQLASALRDLRSGQLLRETASAHNIPRSTLYVRAKAEGIPITVTRQEHSGENVNAAVQAVNKGASLQQASEMYQIPKTVLWRRVKAAGSSFGRVAQKSYGPLHWQAAVQALQDGQNLSRVSAQFQIPKTTLFREKARLIEAGKLPWTSLKKRESQSHSMKHSRLKEAVAACKEGKMSQAVASITYQVPKTTIWRKLKKGTQPKLEPGDENVRSVEITEPGAEDVAVAVPGTLQEQAQFTFIEGNNQLPVTYIVQEDFSTSSLII